MSFCRFPEWYKNAKLRHACAARVALHAARGSAAAQAARAWLKFVFCVLFVSLFGTFCRFAVAPLTINDNFRVVLLGVVPNA